MALVTTRTIQGVSVDIQVTERGKFLAVIKADEYDHVEFQVQDSLDEALNEARRAIHAASKRAKTNAEVTIVDVRYKPAMDRWHEAEVWSGYSNSQRSTGLLDTVDCLYRGRNQQRRYKDSYLVTVNGQKLRFEQTGGSRQILRRLTDAEASEYKAIAQLIIAAHQAMEDFQAARRLDVNALENGEIKLLGEPPKKITNQGEEE